MSSLRRQNLSHEPRGDLVELDADVFFVGLGGRHLRNTIQGSSAYTNSPTDEDLERPARCRVRRYAFQVILIGAMVAAGILRNAKTFLAKQSAPGGSDIGRTQRKKHNRLLEEYRPDPPHSDCPVPNNEKAGHPSLDARPSQFVRGIADLIAQIRKYLDGARGGI